MPRPAEPAHRAVRVRPAPRRGCQLLHGLRRTPQAVAVAVKVDDEAGVATAPRRTRCARARVARAVLRAAGL